MENFTNCAGTNDGLWPAYFSMSDQSMLPPTKKTKTTHPHAVICCDQPCQDDNTSVCFQDYCTDFCGEFLPDTTGPGHAYDSCLDSCLQTCPETLPHVAPDCIHDCTPNCTDQCDLDCNDFCTADCFDTCDHPETVCMDECANWCTSHCLADCLECNSSPAVTDVLTPQMPCTLDHILSPPIDLHNRPLLSHSATPAFEFTPFAGTPHVCRVKNCSAGCFKDEESLQEHIEKNHLVKIDGRYVCQWEGCVKKVTKKSNDHIEKEKKARATGGTYVPPPEPFSDDHLHKLKRHYYVHSGKKAFECTFPGCGSVHATKAQLKVHMARHNPKEFICPSCDKVFTTQNQLKTHVNAVHKKEKHFKCPDCDYACDDSSNMSSHKRKQHQFGVPCPGHLETGCTYRDGRLAEMEKHMRSCGHGEWLLDDKDSFDTFWKRERKAADEERLNDEALRGESRRGSHSAHHHHHSQGHRRQNKIQHRKRASTSLSGNASVSATPSSASFRSATLSRQSTVTIDEMVALPPPAAHYAQGEEVGLATLAQLMTQSDLTGMSFE